MGEVQREMGDLPYLSSNYIDTTSQTKINNEATQGGDGQTVDWIRNGKKIKENEYPEVVPLTHSKSACAVPRSATT